MYAAAYGRARNAKRQAKSSHIGRAVVSSDMDVYVGVWVNDVACSLLTKTKRRNIRRVRCRSGSEGQASLNVRLSRPFPALNVREAKGASALSRRQHDRSAVRHGRWQGVNMACDFAFGRVREHASEHSRGRAVWW